MPRLKDHDAIRRIARKSLFEGLDGLREGAIIVDHDARIVWISDKYAARLGLASAAAAEGRVVGAAGFMLFDTLASLQPLVSKFQQLQTELASTRRSLAEVRRTRYTFSSFLAAELLGISRATLYEKISSLAPRVGERRH